ncbi:TIGR03086 family protein [Mycobacterium sp. Y57]|uniref:TIGR03086 family metal-binding protein n=1 Tax=Mycolicibacterium xanthum TaxID=2796469 RepID=UPI001C85982E|nr:TIGR03086 family metal-binding protein [Mycolicibacterium xanthum]MBX7430979.1 TIGR03086 family protein [Mycolicibacterium xanthum]
MIDMTTACARTAELLAAVGDDQLSRPTPCREMDAAALVTHLGGLASAFTAAARKEFGELTDTPPVPGASLDDDWRSDYPRRLVGLAAAWLDSAAWERMTRAGGIDFPAEVGGLIALTEVVVHGWDLARAVGLPYRVDEDLLGLILPHVAAFAENPVEGLFDAPVVVPGDAPLLDRVVAMTGREPGWPA